MEKEKKRKNLFADAALERSEEQENLKEKVLKNEKSSQSEVEGLDDELGLTIKRKSKQRGMAMTIYIKPDDKEKLKKYAELHDVSCSEVISKMINKYC